MKAISADAVFRRWFPTAGRGGMSMGRIKAIRRLLCGVAIAMGLPALSAGPVVADDPVTLGVGVQPHVAVDPNGKVIVVFVRDDTIRVSLSVDGGLTYGEAMTVDKPSGMPIGMRRGPRIAATRDAFVVTAVSGPTGGGKDGDVWVWRSVDAGQSWARNRKPLNSVLAAAREGLHGMAASPDGLVVCAWLDLRNAEPTMGGTEIWCAVSKDDGKTWGEDRLVYRSSETTVCQCCHPSVAIDATGRILVMFRNTLGGARDMYLAVSENGGDSFSDARKIGNGSWRINACPMDGGAVTVRGDDIVTIWRRQSQIYTASSDGPEMRIGVGAQPVACLTDRGLHAIWTDGSTLMSISPVDSRPQILASKAAYPSIATGAGADRPVIAVWEQQQDVVARRLSPQSNR